MRQTITIDPITRLEGHGKISIFLDDDGEVEKALLQVPELRGFEAFCVGRPAEEMPQITSRICGICPSAHHMASAKALDALYGVAPTKTARLIRELFYSLFFFEDHALHFFYLAAPDFVVGPDASPASRNVLGLIDAVGAEAGRRVIRMRARAREIMVALGGKAVHPVLGLPGGVAKQVSEATRDEAASFGRDAVEFARFSIGLFEEAVLGKPAYVDLIRSDAFVEPTYYMGMVDDAGRLSLYDGLLRVVDPSGCEVERFPGDRYTEVLAEHVEPWSYIKFPFLKKVGWKGFTSGQESGLVRVAPLARLNVADGLTTPLAQAEQDKMFDLLGGKPAHNTLATHWARLVELLHAAERVVELAGEEALTTGSDLRNMELRTPREGVGVVEAPRGTLIHHYETDDRGVLTGVNLLVATQFNSAPICLSIEKAAREFITHGDVREGLLNRVEMAFRAYDPCLSCATHSLPGAMPLALDIRDQAGSVIKRIVRDQAGQKEADDG